MWGIGKVVRADVSSWFSLLSLPTPLQRLITVDLQPIWGQHLAWSKNDGGTLRTLITQRYASSMVFMALLLTGAMNVLFSPCDVSSIMRMHLREASEAEILNRYPFQDGQHSVLQQAIGVLLIFSIFFAIIALTSTFVAWAIVSAISDENTHCIVRSSVGLYATRFPLIFISITISCFFAWMILWLVVLLPSMAWSIPIVVIFVCIYLHMVAVYSALGQVIMHTSAMVPKRIFSKEEEERKPPILLQRSLIDKTKEAIKHENNIIKQYTEEKVSDDDADEKYPRSDAVTSHMLARNYTFREKYRSSRLCAQASRNLNTSKSMSSFEHECAPSGRDINA